MIPTTVTIVFIFCMAKFHMCHKRHIKNAAIKTTPLVFSWFKRKRALKSYSRKKREGCYGLPSQGLLNYAWLKSIRFITCFSASESLSHHVPPELRSEE